MKKIISIVLCLVMMMSCASVFANDLDIRITYKGADVEFLNAPFIVEGTTYVPIRAIANTLGVENEYIAYDDATRVVDIVKGDVAIKLTIGSDKAMLNGEEVTMQAPAIETKGSTFVHIRFISSAFGVDCNYTQVTDENGMETGAIIEMVDKGAVKFNVIVGNEAPEFISTLFNLFTNGGVKKVDDLKAVKETNAVIYDNGTLLAEDVKALADAGVVKDIANELKASNEEAYNKAVANDKCAVDGKVYGYPVVDGDSVQVFYIGADVANVNEVFGIIDNYASVVNAARQ